MLTETFLRWITEYGYIGIFSLLALSAYEYVAAHYCVQSGLIRPFGRAFRLFRRTFPAFHSGSLKKLSENPAFFAPQGVAHKLLYT